MLLPSLTECAATVDRLAPALLSAAARSVLVLGLAGLAALLMRRASAAARHGVWVLGFAGALLLPVLSATLPGWHILPRLGGVGPSHRASPSTEVVTALPTPVPALPSAPPANSIQKETIMNAASESSSHVLPQTVVMTPAAPLQPDAPISQPSQSASTQDSRPASLPMTFWLFLCWTVGTLLVLSHVLLGHLSLWLLRPRCAAVTRGELFDLLQRLREELGIRRPVELLSSPRRTMPMTWGLWRARLLVPEQAANWPAAQRRDVLLHELGHVKRLDCLTQLLAQVGCALYWFNPLTWFASRRMQIERERACDDLVLNSGAEARTYARHLLQSVSSVPALRLAGAAVAMARPSTLEERMRAILDARLNRRALTARGSLATILLLLSALVPVAVLKAQPAPAQAPPTRTGAAAALAAIDKDAPPESPATRPATNPPNARPGSPGPRPGGRPIGFGGSAAPAVPTLGEGPTCTLDATIYDLRLPVEQIGRLDVEALAGAAATPDAFEKALAALGTAKPLYRASQSVRLSGDNIVIGSEVPFVTSSRVSDKGQTMNSVQYMSTGALFGLAGRAGAAGNIDLDLSIQVSAVSDSGAKISDDIKAPVIRKATISHKGPIEARKPFVVVSVDAGSADGAGKAVAYIGRITMGEPQGPGAK